MVKKSLVTVPSVKSWLPEAPFLDDELLIINGIFNSHILPQGNIVTCGVFIGLCTEGDIYCTVDMEEFKLQKNDVILINDRKMVQNVNASPNAKMFCLFGTIDFFQEVAKDLGNISKIFLFIRTHPQIHLPDELAMSMKSYMATLQCKLVQEKHLFRRETVTSLFRALVYDMCDYIWSTHEGIERGANTRSQRMFNDFLSLLEKNFMEQRRVAWYAEEMGISAKYLSETVKEVSGVSPNGWIDKFIILELRNILRNTSLSIKEITIKMNFPNQSFLGKYFKKHVGISPTEYRENK